MSYFKYCLALGLWAHSLSAIILVGGDNGINLTNPGTGAPWDEVSRVTNSSGSHVTSGSAVHLGGGYMLTANHVNLSQGYVSFDGATTYQIAGGSAVQVTSGADSIDLKVFQLTTNPGTAGVNLLPEIYKGVELVAPYNQATQIGWGLGHDPADLSNPWSWGDTSTSEKRWGVNVFTRALGVAYGTSGYEALETVLDSDATANEAAATSFDSGSGLFIEDDVGNWFLAGTIAGVSTGGSSTFANDGSEDSNYSVRIAEYANEIIALMADPIAVPEVSSFALLMGLVSLSCLNGRRGATRSKTHGSRRCL